MRFIFITMLAVLAVGCAAVQTQSRPNSYYQSANTNSFSGNTPFKSLTLGAGKKGLTNKHFARILAHRLKLPKKVRIAVLRLNANTYWRSYSSNMSELTKSLVNRFFNVLRESPRVYDASFLPAMILPAKYNMTDLRIAAANYQADLLLTYRTRCNAYARHRVFKADKAKYYCSVEAILMDVRTGITPFSITSTNSFQAVENRKDLNFQETKKKAELEAISKSMNEIAEGLLGWLKRTKTS